MIRFRLTTPCACEIRGLGLRFTRYVASSLQGRYRFVGDRSDGTWIERMAFENLHFGPQPPLSPPLPPHGESTPHGLIGDPTYDGG